MKFQTLMISTNQTFSNVTTILCITPFKLHVIMKQEEKIKDLEERISLIEADNSALLTDLTHWKNVANGLKGRNKQLSERLQHYKELDLEGDGLYEKKIAECEEKDKVISGLNSQASKLNRCIESKDNEIKALSEKLETMQKQVSMPWWKKIFS